MLTSYCMCSLSCSRTKLMDLMVAKEWARRLHGTGIEVRLGHQADVCMHNAAAKQTMVPLKCDRRLSRLVRVLKCCVLLCRCSVLTQDSQGQVRAVDGCDSVQLWTAPVSVRYLD